MNDVQRAALDRLDALGRAADRAALIALVRARVLARTRGDAATRAAVTAHAAAIAGGFERGLYHAVTLGLVPALAAVFTPPGHRPSLDDRLTVTGDAARLHDLAAAGTTLFVAPTHSSNLDAIALGVAMRRAGLPACAYAAGEHLYRHRVAGALMRHLGGFRVERGRTTALYKVTLKAFAAALLERGLHTVVFPGATRCRDNRVETALQLGLLGAAVAAERRGPHRLAVVPVTINHQVVLEAAHLVAYHLAGRGHERVVGDELFVPGRLLATARRLRALDQRVVIHLGAPLGLDGRPFDPAAPRPAADPRAVAGALVAAYRRDTVLLDTHVVAAALFDLLAATPALVPLGRVAPTDLDLARSPGGVTFPRARVLDAIARTTGALAGRRRLDPDRPPAALLASAISAWHAAHRERVATATGDHVRVDDPRLIFFYRNRCV